ncbi:vitamin K epoxide reductase family protein [Propionibacterium australiense]|uniref:Vitamin K epoxide reductase family n=1 Tax=Propionibacterium australiense TaxID=119981 RepID=A0A383S3M1_9ACTN|nr:vitamin K epoxide reductase family protein [Propionibacterium australiense]SYZ32628.1 Vitamin K epoxide reductase family [Propionibacterium australiense]VEH91621.1 VKOR family protein [Propionibacterium australiense]
MTADLESGTVELDPDLTGPAPQRWRARTATEMIVSGLLGLFVSFKLSIEAWELAGDPGLELACDINERISCVTVAQTWQATLLGFPNAFLGILFEGIVLAISVATVAGVRFPRWYMRCAEALYTVALLFALWLFTQSYFVIHALCPWCLLITVTTTLVWAGLTRMNVRDHVLPSSARMRWFVASGNDWIITIAVLLVLAGMVLVRYILV